MTRFSRAVVVLTVIFCFLLFGTYIEKEWSPVCLEAGVGENNVYSVEENNINSDELRGLLDLNSAIAEELESLPGIGPGLAGRIIEYRENNSGFNSIDELLLISGIGDKTYNKIKNFVCVR